jgi:hypothetical protein
MSRLSALRVSLLVATSDGLQTLTLHTPCYFISANATFMNMYRTYDVSLSSCATLE